MKTSFVLVVLALVAIVFAIPSRLATAPEADVKKLWKQFKSKHEKVYGVEEEDNRYQIFKANVEKARHQNLLEMDKHYGVSKFADLSPEEFRKKYLMPKRSPQFMRKTLSQDAIILDKYESNKPLPKSWDWRQKGAVTKVKNQAQCGSCWAFSTTGNLEGQNFIKNKKLVSLSEQNLVDCDHNCVQYEGEQSCDAGCNGGLMWSAMDWIKKNGGLDTEESYQYEGVDDTCRFKNATIGVRVSGVKMLPTKNEDLAAWIVDNGPAAVAVNAEWLQLYTGGISNPPWCDPTALDHGVLIVGHGRGSSWFGEVNYWLVKNSWGDSWGESGYFKLAWGKCGIATVPSSAVVE